MTDENTVPSYNTTCCHYCETTTVDGKTLSRDCAVGMDMDFCTANCAFADTKPKTAGSQK